MKNSTPLFVAVSVAFATFSAFTAQAQAPFIVASLPAANAPSAASTATVDITFTGPVSAAAASQIKVFGNQRRGLRTGLFTGGGTSTLHFQPATAFAPGEILSVTVPATVAGTAKAWQFSAATPEGTGTFIAAPDVPTGFSFGNYARTLAADLNNDGYLDLLNPNGSDNSIGVYLASAAGQFNTPTNVPVLLQPDDVVVGDIDNDGDLDLLSSSYHVGYGFSFRLNNGAGQFSGGGDVLFPYPCAPNRITVADIDADGYLDVILSNSDTDNSIGFCHNNGNNTFGPVTRLGITRPFLLTVGDITGDGAIDLLVVQSNGGQSAPSAIVPFINDGSGNFTRGTSIRPASAGNMNGLVVGDVDADGDLDLLLAYNSASQGLVEVELNDGTGHFSSRQSVPTAVGTNLQCLAIGDVDGDGDLDFVAGGIVAGPTSSPDVVSVRLNDGTGWFYNAPDVSMLYFTKALTLADVNNDGALDIIGQGSNGSVGIRLNKLAQAPVQVTPGQGAVGSIVTITGTGLQGTTAVLFNGTPAIAFTVNAVGTALTATVPVGTRSGRVSLTSAQGTAFSTNRFTVLLPTATRSSGADFITSLFPNPAQEHLTLVLAGKGDAVKIELLDVLGRCVRQQNILHSSPGSPLDITLTGIPAGIYCLRATSGTASISRRFEIQ